MMYFAAQLAAALKEAKISKSELARRVPCSPASIGDWCSGRHQPRPHQLDRINIILGADLTLARTVTAKEVARALGMCKTKLYEAMREGTTDVGFVTRSKGGKRRCYRFYPKIVAEKCGI
jgi:hypothetical protein